MRYSKLFVWLALAGGVALPGASTLSAQVPYGRDAYNDRRDLRSDYRDMSHDYANADRLRGDIARDQARFNEAVRCGRPWEANAISRDIARDRQALFNQVRDIRHDRQDTYYDRRDLRRDNRDRDGWR
jgi:hypothetical protein